MLHLRDTCIRKHLPGWASRGCLTIKPPFCLLVGIKSFTSHILYSIASIYHAKANRAECYRILHWQKRDALAHSVHPGGGISTQIAERKIPMEMLPTYMSNLHVR